MTYLITFACYGSHLHGNESGSVDRDHRLFGGRMLQPNPERLAAVQESMDQPPYQMDSPRRSAVLEAIHEVGSHRGWKLLAAHVRTNHVHAVVAAECRPEPVLNSFKAYASRRLNSLAVDPPGRKRWARHGSTRWLFDSAQISAAVRYVVEEQGEPMAVFLSEP